MEKTECPCDKCEDFCPTPMDCEIYMRWAHEMCEVRKES